MSVNKTDFGKVNGQTIEQYVLTNENGITLKVMTYGATITSLQVPDKKGKTGDIVCGFNTIEGYLSDAYLNNAPYFGCTVGRFASRIKDGKFSVDGKEYTLDVNNGSNHLHGGVNALDKRIWTAEVTSSGVEMSIVSDHMDNGFPGLVNLKVSFSINNDNELSIRYKATTDQKTPLSLTNHTYFNLSAFQHTIVGHEATILADKFLVPDETNVPVGEETSVDGTPADLRQTKKLNEALQAMETGFEHYYVFDENTNLRKVAAFSDAESGRSMQVYTTEPGMLFYSGFFTSDELKRESGEKYGRFRAFCCEAHRYPNGPNIEGAPGAFTTPDQPYESRTVFKFDF